jgi:hypothetical protein
MDCTIVQEFREDMKGFTVTIRDSRWRIVARNSDGSPKIRHI